MSKRSRRWSPPKFTLLVLALVCAHAHATPVWVSAQINRSADKTLVEVDKQGDDFIVSRLHWENDWHARWRWPEQDTVSLKSLANEGVSYTFDQRTVSLSVILPVEWLTSTTTIEASAPTVAAPNAHGRGLVWSYDAFARHDQGGVYGGVWNDARVFFDNNTSFQANASTSLGETNDTVRLDSVWQWNDPDRMISVKAGDSVLPGPDWTRPVRMGGVWVGRDFSLQPYRTTVPLASYVGQATLPSKVDVFVNGVLQSQQDVQPGQFQINGIVPSTGASLATAQVTDITGRVQTISIPLYGNTTLLQKGLWDGGVGLGYVRRNYGLSSFDYDPDPFASVSLRYGVSNMFTLDTHAEGSKQGQMWGLGGNVQLGQRGGLLRASLSQSQNAGRNGSRQTVEYQWSSPLWSLTAGQQSTSTNFWDVAVEEGDVQKLRQRYAFSTVNTNGSTFGVGYVDNKTPLFDTQAASLFYSKQLSSGSSVYISATHTTGTQTDNRVGVYYYKPFGPSRSGSVSLDHTSTGSTAGMDVMQARAAVGWGGRAQLRTGQTDRATAEVAYANTALQANVGVDYTHSTQSNTAVYGGVQGSVVWMNGLHPSRQITDSFAVVSTQLPNIPVMVENNFMGNTNSHGVLLLPTLQPYQRNKISVDVSSLPVQYKIPETSQWVVPRHNQGVNVLFDLQPVSSITATVVDSTNTPLPLGTVLKHGATKVVVGYDGMVYIEQPPQTLDSDEFHCSLSLPSATGFTNAGTLVCK